MCIQAELPNVFAVFAILPLSHYARLYGNYFMGKYYQFYIFYPWIQLPGRFLKHPVYRVIPKVSNRGYRWMEHVKLIIFIIKQSSIYPSKKSYGHFSEVSAKVLATLLEITSQNASNSFPPPHPSRPCLPVWGC